MWPCQVVHRSPPTCPGPTSQAPLPSTSWNGFTPTRLRTVSCEQRERPFPRPCLGDSAHPPQMPTEIAGYVPRGHWHEQTGRPLSDCKLEDMIGNRVGRPLGAHRSHWSVPLRQSFTSSEGPVCVLAFVSEWECDSLPPPGVLPRNSHVALPLCVFPVPSFQNLRKSAFPPKMLWAFPAAERAAFPPVPATHNARELRGAAVGAARQGGHFCGNALPL